MWLLDILFRPIINWLNNSTRTVPVLTDIEAPPAEVVIGSRRQRQMEDPREMKVWQGPPGGFIGGWAPGKHLRGEPVPPPRVPTFHALPPSVYRATDTYRPHLVVARPLPKRDGALPV